MWLTSRNKYRVASRQSVASRHRQKTRSSRTSCDRSACPLADSSYWRPPCVRSWKRSAADKSIDSHSSIQVEPCHEGDSWRNGVCVRGHHLYEHSFRSECDESHRARTGKPQRHFVGLRL